MAPKWQRLPDDGSILDTTSKASSKGSSKGSDASSKKSGKPKRSKSEPKPLPQAPYIGSVPEVNYSNDPRFFAGQIPYGGVKKAIVGTPLTSTTGYFIGDAPVLGEYAAVGEGKYARKRRRLCSVQGVFFLLGNGIFLALPFIFLVLIILAARLDGQPVDNNQSGKSVHDGLQLAVTIFPFAFAAIAGRTMKAGARYLLERGAKIGVVESLLGSQSLWQTYKMQFLLRRVSILTIPVLFLWILSPVGSQGALRLLDTRFINSTTSVDTALILQTGGMSEDQIKTSAFFGGDTIDQRNSLMTIKSLYTAALFNPNKNTPRDIWGNVKVPRVNTSNPGGDWVPTNDIAQNASIDSYTALTGIPVGNVPLAGEANFTFDSAHFVLDCPIIFNASYTDTFWKGTLAQIWGTSKGHEDDVFRNSTTDTQTNFFLDTNPPLTDMPYLYRNKSNLGDLNPNNAPTQARNILFGARIPVPGSTIENIVIRNCTVQLEYVESAVGCIDGKCQVDRVRKSPRYADFNTLATPLDFPDIAKAVFKGLPYATGVATYDGETPSGLFLRGSNSPIILPNLGLDGNSNPNLRLPDVLMLPKEVFAQRLATLLNTYYQLSLAPASYLGNLPSLDSKAYGASACPAGQNCLPTNASAPFFPAVMPLNHLYPMEVYHVDYLWLGLTAACAAILFVVGILGIMTRNRCHVPDMLGYASSSISDNGALHLPPSTGPLDGVSRSREIGDVRIRIMDPRLSNVYPRYAAEQFVDQ